MNSNVKNIAGMLDDGVNKRLSASGILVQNEARRLCPVDTGRLRSSITNEPLEDSVIIGTNVEYGPVIELGSAFQSAQPYLRPGLMNSLPALRALWGSPLA